MTEINETQILTDTMVQALRAEAGAAGDEAQVGLCDQALAGDRVAQSSCAVAINSARAMDDSTPVRVVSALEQETTDAEAQGQAEAAIKESAGPPSERVTIELDEGSEAQALRAALARASDDSVDRNDGTHEFWGVDDEGHDWRVHVVIEEDDAVDDASTLYARLMDGKWTVEDTAGGIWWPNDAASAEIARASDPEQTTLDMCANDPMSGIWRN